MTATSRIELPEVGRHVTIRLERPDYTREVTGTVIAATLDRWGARLIRLDGHATVALWVDDTWHLAAPLTTWSGKPLPKVGSKITIRQYPVTGPQGATGIVEEVRVRQASVRGEFLDIALADDAGSYHLNSSCPGDGWEHVTTNDDIRRLIEVKRLTKEKDAELKTLKAEEEGLHKSISDSWAEEGQTGAKIGGYTAYLLNNPHVEHSGTDAVLAALLADKLKHLVVTTYHAGAVKSYLADLAKEGQDPPEHLAKVAKLVSGFKIGLRRS
jgi:hypothetical protein